MNTLKSLFTFLFLVLFFSTNSFAQSNSTNRTNIWPTIPFVRGADLCQYKEAHSQTRAQYMAQMTRLASQLMYMGSSPREAWNLLYNFNSLYERNLELATQNRYLDVTLESTLKAFISGYYRDLRPRTQNISFTQNTDLLKLIKSGRNADAGTIDLVQLAKIDYFAYGTYSYASNCREVLVTLTLVGKNGEEINYQGQADTSVVMSRIAAKMFEDFQRTKFPSTIKVGPTFLTLVGGLNGSVDAAVSPLVAKQSCETLNARLPNEFELEILNSYGSWSGGVSLGDSIWALPSGKVFAPHLRNPSPIRDVSEVNATEFNYYCVR